MREVHDDRITKRAVEILESAIPPLAGSREAPDAVKHHLAVQHHWAKAYASELAMNVGGGRIGAGALACIRIAAHSLAWAEECARQAALASAHYDAKLAQQARSGQCRALNCPDPNGPTCNHINPPSEYQRTMGASTRRPLTLMQAAARLGEFARHQILTAHTLTVAQVNDAHSPDLLDAFLDDPESNPNATEVRPYPAEVAKHVQSAHETANAIEVPAETNSEESAGVVSADPREATPPSTTASENPDATPKTPEPKEPT